MVDWNIDANKDYMTTRVTICGVDYDIPREHAAIVHALMLIVDSLESTEDRLLSIKAAIWGEIE